MRILAHWRWFISVFLLLLIAWFCYQNFVWKQKKIVLGLPDDVMQQPFLALQGFAELNNQDLLVSTEYPLLFSQQAERQLVPNKNGVLIIGHSDQLITARQAEAILAWVEQGGHLIFATDAAMYRQLRDIYDPLWLKFQIRLSFPTSAEFQRRQENKQLETKETLEPQDNTEAEQKNEAEANSEVVKSPEYQSQINTADGQVFYVNLNKSYRIQIPQETEIINYSADRHGYTFVQFKRQQGLVSLLTHIDLWNNIQLADANNGYFYQWLTTSSTDILLMHSVAKETWLVRLSKWSPMLIACLILYILFFVWRQAVRFGPAYQLDETSVQFFNQHIEAAGDYYWQHGQSDRLIDALQSEVLELAQRRWPGFASWPEQTRILHLHEQTELPQADIQAALNTAKHKSEDSFTLQVQVLQKIRKII
ncbi:DUF4350 domain-containing protein [Gayadomonas joobiniege]|uniref:DUF4350 domain-containing protein n=1 Tax=Gayadomonas joobiniege TaxID=1234606 RepID=UPI0003790C46|nr:DUF4350 domain-containing protein [Gayadomonas joobiniege]